MALHHFAIISSSIENLEFYRKLGFEEFFRKVRGYDTVVLMRGHGIQLEMFIDPDHHERAEEKGPFGLLHLALKVDNLEKIRQEFQCGPIITDWMGERYCVTKDPDGLVIELHE